MISFFKEIKKYLFIYVVFIKNCLIKQMEYRANFFLGMAVETAFLCSKILYIIVVFRVGVSINGLSPDTVLIFIGTYTIMTGIYMSLFFFNFSQIQQYVRDGSLDMFITKPISLQFMVTLRNVDVGTPIPNIVGGIVIVVFGWSKTGIPVTFVNIAGYVGFLIGATILTYSLMLMPQLLSFWLIRTHALREIADSLWDFNNMPMHIYGKRIQQVGTFILPIFLIANFSPLFILNQLNIYYLIWGILAPVLFLGLSRLMWSVAMRNYCSASS